MYVFKTAIRFFYWGLKMMSIIDKKKRCRAFTLIELLMLVAIIGTLMALAIPNVFTMIHKTRIKAACADIKLISKKLDDHLIDNGYLPVEFSIFTGIRLTDPWGNPYQYMIILGKDKNDIKGKWRKDRFLVPLNYDFDLYSMGKDGKSRAPLTAATSHDDVIRANNGDYVGIASKY